MERAEASKAKDRYVSKTGTAGKFQK